ncbi:MAG: hypothetical protein ACK5N8_06305 [Alphaproteobacteria bacterium]
MEENRGIRTILILLTIFSLIVLAAIFMVYSEDTDEALSETSLWQDIYIYLKYYAAKFVGFIFRV